MCDDKISTCPQFRIKLWSIDITASMGDITKIEVPYSHGNFYFCFKSLAEFICITHYKIKSPNY